jgi:hypothetical protein
LAKRVGVVCGLLRLVEGVFHRLHRLLRSRLRLLLLGDEFEVEIVDVGAFLFKEAPFNCVGESYSADFLLKAQEVLFVCLELVMVLLDFHLKVLKDLGLKHGQPGIKMLKI